MHVSFSYIFLYIIHRLNATLIFVYLTYIFNEITNYNKKQYCSKSPSSQAQNRIKNNFVRLDPIVETMLRRAIRISWIFIHVSNAFLISSNPQKLLSAFASACYHLFSHDKFISPTVDYNRERNCRNIFDIFDVVVVSYIHVTLHHVPDENNFGE